MVRNRRAFVRRFIPAVLVSTLLGFPPKAVAGPQGWTSVDVGAVGINGNAVEDNGVWTIQGAGRDIWGSADAFQFLYRQTNVPNGRVVVRVDDLQDTNPYAKVGVMVRTHLDPRAATIILDMKPSGEIEFMSRPIYGTDTVYQGGTFVTTPAWLKLEWFPSGSAIAASVSEDNANWTLVGSVKFTPLPSYDVGVAVTSHDDQQLTTAHIEGLSFVPLAWINSDIGATGLTGNTVVADANGRSFSIQGAGGDIWGFADAFQFLYQQQRSVAAGIQARVLSEQATNGFAKVGVMIRNGLAPDAAFVILDMKPNGELEFMQRDADGGQVTYLGGAAPGFRWMRLVRQVSIVTAYGSSDGVNWTQVGTTSVDMPTSANLGIAVTSHDTSQLNSGSVTDVSVVNESAGRTIVNFDGLTSNGAPVTSYTESGFTVEPTAGAWIALITYGHPAPFIEFYAPAGTTVTGEVLVTAGGSLFSFDSIDLYSSTTPIPYTITGLRDSSEVFTLSDTLPNTFGNFTTVANPNPDAVIDTLSIALTNPSAPCCSNPMGLDTIVLTR